MVCHAAHQCSYEYHLSPWWDGTGGDTEKQKGPDFFQCWHAPSLHIHEMMPLKIMDGDLHELAWGFGVGFFFSTYILHMERNFS